MMQLRWLVKRPSIVDACGGVVRPHVVRGPLPSSPYSSSNFISSSRLSVVSATMRSPEAAAGLTTTAPAAAGRPAQSEEHRI